jgi:uncharacterized membrane protein (GlpM family)
MGVNFALKLLAANAVIVACTQLGKRLPSLAGLIATMPLTTLIVMVWLHSENPGNYDLMVSYSRGVLWGILPSAAFFVAALCCFTTRMPFLAALAASFVVWLVGAFVHQWFLA